jgi:Group II intron, maturase-specific domain/Reverse transcriptase (RNA-dependent DNA polymerase)
VRYADDLIIVCSNEEKAKESHRRLKLMVKQLGLELKERKTRVVDSRRQGFDFLGFHHRGIRLWRGGRISVQRWPSVKAMTVIRSKVKAVSNRSMISKSMPEIVAFLNPILRGWWQYFRWGRSGHATMCMNGWPYLTRINGSVAVAGGTPIIRFGSID